MNFHAVSAVNQIRNWSRWNSSGKSFSVSWIHNLIHHTATGNLRTTKEKWHNGGRHRQSTPDFFSGWITLHWFKVSMMLDIQDVPSLSVLTKKLSSFCLSLMEFAGEVELKETSIQEEEGKRDQHYLPCCKTSRTPAAWIALPEPQHHCLLPVQM